MRTGERSGGGLALTDGQVDPVGPGRREGGYGGLALHPCALLRLEAQGAGGLEQAVGGGHVAGAAVARLLAAQGPGHSWLREPIGGPAPKEHAVTLPRRHIPAVDAHGPALCGEMKVAMSQVTLAVSRFAVKAVLCSSDVMLSKAANCTS